MSIQLEKMSESDFDAYSDECIRDFAHQLQKIRILSDQEALEEAEKSFQKSLPRGYYTENTYFLNIILNDQVIGRLRFEVRQMGSFKQCFGWDFKVFPAFSGHGIEAMRAARAFMKDLGCSKLSLHVFSKNERALKLYQAMGFGVDSYNMSIDL